MAQVHQHLRSRPSSRGRPRSAVTPPLPAVVRHAAERFSIGPRYRPRPLLGLAWASSTLEPDFDPGAGLEAGGFLVRSRLNGEREGGRRPRGPRSSANETRPRRWRRGQTAHRFPLCSPAKQSRRRPSPGRAARARRQVVVNVVEIDVRRVEDADLLRVGADLLAREALAVLTGLPPSTTRTPSSVAVTQ